MAANMVPSPPVVVETRNYGGEEKQSNNNSGRGTMYKFFAIGGLFIALIVCVCVFGYLLILFTERYWGGEGVKYLSRVLGWGSGILIITGVLYVMQWLNTRQLIAVHNQTIQGIVRHQMFDDMGEIGRLRANDETKILPSVIRAMADANGNARQIAQETHRHARFLADKDRDTATNDTQAFLARLAQMPTDGVIDLE